MGKGCFVPITWKLNENDEFSLPAKIGIANNDLNNRNLRTINP
jgi:hypothetical protein